MERRDFLRLIGVTFAAPLPVLRSLVDPLRGAPAAIEALTPLHLIGWRTPRLFGPRWSEAKLLREPADALESMTRAARADGVDVWARSGHRTLSQQRYLWNSKYRGLSTVRADDGSRLTLTRDHSAAEKVRLILSYTAFPGTSRHHWGTDVDMAQTFADGCADLLLREGLEPASSGEPGEPDPGGEPAAGQKAERGADDCLPAQRWLAARAHEFGWYLVYDVARGGVQPEPWHWSYLPYAVPALARYLDEVDADLLRDRGVDGDDVVLDDFASYRDRFILGIRPEALPGSAVVAPEEPSTSPVPDS
ncbi:MAG: M15 family metallopeptidase [Deltaproteobacteria bacterium]|nr:M15 family metallopeptidase [Deltaproteobacteria bacterium]